MHGIRPMHVICRGVQPAAGGRREELEKGKAWLPTCWGLVIFTLARIGISMTKVDHVKLNFVRGKQTSAPLTDKKRKSKLRGKRTMATKKSTPTMKASRPAPLGKWQPDFLSAVSLTACACGCVRMAGEISSLVDESVDRQKRKSEVCGWFSV